MADEFIAWCDKCSELETFASKFGYWLHNAWPWMSRKKYHRKLGEKRARVEYLHNKMLRLETVVNHLRGLAPESPEWDYTCVTRLDAVSGPRNATDSWWAKWTLRSLHNYKGDNARWCVDMENEYGYHHYFYDVKLSVACDAALEYCSIHIGWICPLCNRHYERKHCGDCSYDAEDRYGSNGVDYYL